MGAVPIDVEQVSLPGISVADVRDTFDIATAEDERREEDLGQGKALPQATGRRGVELGRHPGPRPSFRACSRIGRVCNARRMMTTSPALAMIASPNAIQPRGEPMSPWPIASAVEATSQ